MGNHGIVKAVKTHFEYEDGTIFYPFGTTVYALAHQDENLIKQTLTSLANSPFNKVRMCVFPKHYQYNNNEPIYYPFNKNLNGEWDVSSPNEAFWEHLERIIRNLDKLDIQCDLILFHPYDNWGFCNFTQEDNLKYVDYCINRLGHLDNIWWSLANEYDLQITVKSFDDWCEIEEYVATHDTRHHLLSNHNCFIPWDVSRKNITHGSYQTKRFPDIADVVKKYDKPIMVDECCYEGNLPEFWGSISAEEMTARFWQVMVSGAYCTHGETFLDDNDIIWWSKGGKLKGKSPERIAFLKDIIQKLPSPIYPADSWQATFDNLPEEVKESMKQSIMFNSFHKAIEMMTPENRHLHFYAEYCYSGFCENKSAFINYYYLRCCAKDTLSLPADKLYNIEIIDTWNMTKETIAEAVNGEVTVNLPGKPYIAVIATAI